MLSLESQRVFCFSLRYINNVMTVPLGNCKFCFPRILMYPKTKSHQVSLKPSVCASVIFPHEFVQT